MADQKIDILFDGPALLAQQRAAVALVEDFIDKVQEAKKLNIDFNVNTKTFADYNKKIKELGAGLDKVQASSDKATKSATLLAKQQEAAAKAALAETKAQDAAAKSTERMAAASEKARKKKEEEIRPYKQLSLAFAQAAREAQDLGAKYGVMDKRAQAAAKTANQLNDRLKEIDTSMGINNRRVGSYSEALDGFSNKLRNVAGSFLAILGVGSVFRDSINEFIEMDKNVRLLQNTLRNRGIPESFGRIEKSAKALAKEFTFLDDDEILKSFNQLIVYGKLTEDQINELIPVIIDFATATNQDLGAATSTIIKALEGNGKALKEYGINIKDAKSTTEAFGLIMDKLAPKVSGVGKAFAESAAGGLASANQEFKNLKEDLGRDILPALNVLLGVLLKLAQLLSAAAKAAVGLGGALKDAFSSDKTIEFSLRERLGFTDDDQYEINQRQAGILNDIKSFQKILHEQQKQGRKLEVTDEQVKNEILEKLRLKNELRITEARKTRNAELIRDVLNEREAIRRAISASSGLDGAVTAVDDPDKPFSDKGLKEKADKTAQIEFEILKARLELYKENDLAIVNNEKAGYATRTEALIRFGNDSAKLILAQAKFELSTKDLTAAEVVQIEEERNNALYRLAQDLTKRTAEILKPDLKAQAGGLGDTVKGPLSSILNLGARTKKETEEAGKNLREFQRQMKDSLTALGTELTGLFIDLFQNNIERQKNAIQDQIDLLEKQKQKDIEVANQTIVNAQDKADAIIAIEATAQVKRDALELKQRQLDQQKAKFDKANAIAGIIQSTSLAVIRTLAAFPGPQGVALAAIVGAIGAAQLVRAIAQPIPKYAEGVDSHPGGLAFVGDGGKAEGIILPDGTTYKTPSSTTLIDLPKGAQVVADYATMTKPPVYTLQATDNTAELRRVGSNIVKAIKGIPQPILTTEGAWRRAQRTGSNFRNYLNRNI